VRALPAIGVGVLLLAVALFVRAPATLLDGRLEALSEGRLRLADAVGTVWNGSGDVRIVPGDTAIHVAWQVAAWPLLFGRLRGSLVTDGAAAPATFDIGGGNVDIHNLSLTLPAQSLLRAFIASPALVSADGNIGLRVAALARQGDHLDGDLNLHWSAASLRALGAGPGVALGDVRFDATGQGSTLGGALSNTGGDVEISGTASVSLDGRGRINAALRPRAGIDPERARMITTALAAIGRPDAAGGYRVAWP
jgi:general secretion pathway protein N